MANSVIEAIQEGIWNFEPKDPERDDFESTHALPGTQEKVEVLALRLRSGQPLWHPEDRINVTLGDALTIETPLEVVMDAPAE